MLRDLEETLLTITDRASQEFMREAVRCYHAGAYRAAVVMAVSAGMDDLRRKLNEQAASGGAPAPVKKSASDIEKTFKDQKAFESSLIDACEKEASIFAPAEAAKLRLLLKNRHLCAHPSGHISTAEEARSVITSIVDLILSRPALFGMTAVSDILSRLEGGVFFPDPNDPISTVTSEIQSLQPSLHKALAVKVVGRLIEEAKKPLEFGAGNSTMRSNATQFLIGMLGSATTRKTVWSVLATLIESADTTDDVLHIMSANPEGLELAPSLTRDRAVALVRRNLHEPKARSTARSWINNNLLSDSETKEIVTIATAAMLEYIDKSTPNEVGAFGIPAIEQKFFAKAAEEAGSSTFRVSNRTIEAIQAMSASMATRMLTADRVRYLIGVASSSTGTKHFGREARIVVETGLGPRVDFVDALVEWVSQEPESAREEYFAWEQFAKMLKNANRVDALESLLRIFVSHENEQNAPSPEELEKIAEIVPSLAPLAESMKAARAH